MASLVAGKLTGKSQYIVIDGWWKSEETECESVTFIHKWALLQEESFINKPYA